MIAFLVENRSTIVIALVLAGIVALVVRKMIRDKRAGKGCCSGGCTGCAGAANCHGGQQVNKGRKR